MITETGEITKAKNNAQAALALEKFNKGNERTKKQKNDLGKITTLREPFHRSGNRRVNKGVDKLFHTGL